MDILNKIDLITEGIFNTNTKFKNGQKDNVPKELINKARKELSKKHKRKPEDFVFNSIYVPGFKNKVFLMFDVKLYSDKPTSITYELEDKDK
jgi:hypothetical protein